MNESAGGAFSGLARKPKEEKERTTPGHFEGRKRVKDDRRRGIMIRLTPSQWTRIHELALKENTSVQALGLCALSWLFEDRGLSKL